VTACTLPSSCLVFLLRCFVSLECRASDSSVIVCRSTRRSSPAVRIIFPPCNPPTSDTLVLCTRAPLRHSALESSRQCRLRRSTLPHRAPASLVNGESTSCLTSAPLELDGPRNSFSPSARSARFRAHARDFERDSNTRARARATTLGLARENFRVADTGHAPGDLSESPARSSPRREPA
jgi:hypothetical protein